MFDQNGGTVNIFPIFSTIEEEKIERPIDDDGNDSPRVIGNATSTETPSNGHANSNDKVTESTIENSVEIDLKHSGSSLLPFVAGGLAIIGVSTGIMLYKKKK